MNVAELASCPECGGELRREDGHSNLIGVEYAYGSPNRYDGISEWMCPHCRARWGRWTGRRLADEESEPRFGGD